MCVHKSFRNNWASNKYDGRSGMGVVAFRTDPPAFLYVFNDFEGSTSKIDAWVLITYNAPRIGGAGEGGMPWWQFDTARHMIFGEND